MIVYENGREIPRRPRTLAEAKEMIAGLDLSMATVDCDLQEYKVVNARGKVVYRRPRVHVP